MLPFLGLVEPVVSDGPVYRTRNGACGQQAQFQDVFKGAGIRGDTVVLGHVEWFGHPRDSLTVRGRCPFHNIGSSSTAAGKAQRPRSVYAAGGALAGEAAAHPGKIPRGKAGPCGLGPAFLAVSP